MNSDTNIRDVPKVIKIENQAALARHIEGQYPQVQQFATDEDIVLRIVGDGTPHGTTVIDSKSGRRIQGVTGIFLWLDANKAQAKVAMTFQQFEMDLYPPLESYMDFDVIKRKLFEQGFTVVVDEEDEVE